MPAPVIDPDAVLWSAPPAERGGRPLLVLLHGYGSNERDLFALAQHLPPRYVVASLRGPGTNRFGHEWFALDGELAGARGHEQSSVTDRLREDGANAAARAVRAWLGELTESFTLVGLGGFSQGGAIATQVLRQDPERVAFVANLSGFVAPGEVDGDAVLAERRPPVFWARGAADEVIAPFLVERTERWLPAHATLTHRVYPGLGHGVSAQTLGDLVAFLDDRVDGGAGPAR
ncbi:alpha/beta hydrolase [Georgenia ruanii]|uniref:Alpha/beta fold hydrolase n=1 Tax=Georgenia ruanii TaxID=348442 RepID=A0A7J9UX14_9MICO|nr:alpha/beta fold hydrolase [Georgenia ruanii]MPV88903.1 alpha/beta fold hydrolase [Georgenia ruanii]